MYDVDELRLRILGELEEAGVDNVAALCNIIGNPNGPRIELAKFGLAIAALIDAKEAECEYSSRPLYRDRKRLASHEALTEIGKLPQYLSFDTVHSSWRFKDAQVLELILTDQGLRKAAAVLEERGHNWWTTAAG